MIQFIQMKFEMLFFHIVNSFSFGDSFVDFKMQELAEIKSKYTPEQIAHKEYLDKVLEAEGPEEAMKMLLDGGYQRVKTPFGPGIQKTC